MDYTYTIDGYTLGDRIGSGSYGSVYKGIRDSDGMEVAIKITRNAQREIEVLKSLKSEYVIEMLDYGKTTEGFNYDFLVMPILPYKVDSLRLSLEAFIELGYQVSQAIRDIDKAGYSHKDLHLGNIMLDADAKVKIIDFGFAFQYNEDTDKSDVRLFSDRVDMVLDANQIESNTRNEWWNMLVERRQDSPYDYSWFWAEERNERDITRQHLLDALVDNS